MSDERLERWDSLVTPMLVRRVLQDYRLSMKGVHGPHHWLRVLENGLTLTALTPGADGAVVELFALLHDSQRIDEDADLGHGGRAARFLHTLVGEGSLSLDPARLELLCAACERHEYGEVSADPTVGCCWDADRLDLARHQAEGEVSQHCGCFGRRGAGFRLATREHAGNRIPVGRPLGD